MCEVPPTPGIQGVVVNYEEGGGGYKTGGEEASDVLPLQKGAGGRKCFSQAGAGAKKVLR